MRLDDLPPELLRHVASFCAEVHNGCSVEHGGGGALTVRVCVDDAAVRRRVATALLPLVCPARAHAVQRVEAACHFECRCAGRSGADAPRGEYHPRLAPAVRAIEATLPVCNRCATPRMYSFGVRLPARALACVSRAAAREWVVEE